MKERNRTSILVRSVGFLFCAFALVCLASAQSEAAEPSPSPHKNIHVTVESSQLSPFSINEKTEPKEKRLVFYSDQNSSVDVNDNGEPNVNMRF